MTVPLASLPADIRQVFAQDPRIRYVRVYDEGWLPNSYRWPAPGRAREYERLPDGTFRDGTLEYDRKRSHARGPLIVGYSARRGVLASL